MAKARNYSIKDIANWKFRKVEMPQKWHEHLGDVSENFRMLVHGSPKNGKTEYIMQLIKMLTEYYGKVNLNSTEQGRSSSFQDAFLRNKMDEIKPGKFMMAEKSQVKFENWFERLKRPNSGRIIVLDSNDYMHLTFDQYKQLHERFKHKSIILVCWDDPWSMDSKKMKYMMDITVKVDNFKAKIISRFGGNKPYDIWPDRKSSSNQLKLAI